MKIKKIILVLMLISFLMLTIGIVSATNDFQNVKTSDVNYGDKKVDVDADDVAVEYRKNGFFFLKLKLKMMILTNQSKILKLN